MAQQPAMAGGAGGGRCAHSGRLLPGWARACLSDSEPPLPTRAARGSGGTHHFLGGRVGTWKQPRLACGDSSWVAAPGTLPSGNGLL